MPRSRLRPGRAAPRGLTKSHRKAVGLSDALRAWAIENLSEGVRGEELVATLVGAGVPNAIALREIAGLSSSPLLPALRSERAARRRREQVLALRQALESTEIERRPTPSAEEFFARYFEANRPCVLPEFTRGWPARSWTPERLAERFGDEEIEVVRGRNAFPDDYDRRSAQLAVRMPFAEYVALVRAESPTNDLYSVANNKNMERAAFAALLDDVVVDEAWFDRRLLSGGTSFWLGPAGTVTPFHHDTTNILFCQLYGRKEMVLASPLEPSLLDAARGFYSTLRGDAEPFPARRHTVVLEPGDALFLPAGWWHEVRSLDVSISFSLLAFRRRNSFTAYAPGFT